MADSPQTPIFVSAKDAATLLGVSLRTIRGWDAAGKLPEPVRLSPGCVRWRFAELREWAEAGSPNREEWEAAKNGNASPHTARTKQQQ